MCLFARELSNEEGMKLRSMARRSKSIITSRRASVILLSSLGDKAPDIARSQFFSEKYVRQIISNFNSDGFGSLKPAYKGRTDIIFDEGRRQEIARIACSPPRKLGMPFTRWSLRKMQDYLGGHGAVDYISIERLRQILRENKISIQRTKTWKQSNDPLFEVKKNE